MNIGKSIQVIRKRQGLTQEALAEKADISRPSLSQIENNSVRPEQDTLRRICEALQVPESFLYIYSFEREDVPEGKRNKYDLVFPLIQKLIQEVAEEGINLSAGGDRQKK